MEESTATINFYQARGVSHLFTEYSIWVFQKPSETLLDYAVKILEGWKNKSDEQKKDDKKFSWEYLGKAIAKELEKYGFDWKILILKNMTTKVSIDPEAKTIYINGEKKYSKNDVKRLIVHEVWTHIIRSENGRKQAYFPFATGLAGSLNTEEWLAVYSEYINNLLEEETLALYAGRVIASSLCQTKSFFEIFYYLRQYLSEEMTLYITQRVKKGIKDTLEAGGFTKDYVYLDGFIKIKDYINTGKSIDILYTGSIGIDDIDDVQKLIDENIITNKITIPDFMKGKK